MSIIGQIQIEVVHVAEDHRIPFVGYLIRYFVRFPFGNCIPAIYSCRKPVQMEVGSLRMSQRCFLPATELHMILLQIVCHLRDVVFGQFMRTRHSMFIHKRPADRRTHPSSIRHFIASQVNGSQRYLRFFIHNHQLTNHFFHKPIGGG